MRCNILFRNIRWGIIVDILFERDSPDGGAPARTEARFLSRHEIALNVGDIDEQFEQSIETIIGEMEKFTSHGSGWNAIGIVKVTIQCTHYDSIGGSSFLPTPKWLQNKRALVNVVNDKDDKCFLYSILAHKYADKTNPNRTFHYRSYIDDMARSGSLEGLSWPLPIKQIPIFERNNSEYSINVMYVDPDETDHRIVPLYASKYRQREQQVFLLLLTEQIEMKEEDEPLILGARDNFDGLKWHYVLVRHPSRLLSSVTSHDGRVHVCPHCLHRFRTVDLLKKHVDSCSEHKPCRIRFPSRWKTNATRSKNDAAREKVNEDEAVEGIEDLLNLDGEENRGVAEEQRCKEKRDYNDAEFVLKFKHYTNCFPVPAIIYCDFECFIKSGEDGDLHEPSGFCCLTVMDKVFQRESQAVTFSGSNGVMDAFFEHLMREEKIINNLLKRNIPMIPLETEEQKAWDDCKVCPCCERVFTDFNHKVRHHCHATGKYLAPVCNECNLQLKYRKGSYGEAGKHFFIPVIAHGMKNYDSHLIIKSLSSRFVNDARHEVTCIPSNSEKFISFQVHCFRFLDSYQFLNCSLETLAANMAAEGTSKFCHTKRHFPNPVEFDLVTKKGVYPYEYMDSADKLNQDHLPQQADFFSKLYDASVTDEQYAHAQTVWKTFNMTSMKQYHDTYLTTDVLLLADIFENFRSIALSFYQLDPAHYYTLPGFSFDACLRMTRARLELLTDIDQLLFIERGIRGGIATITNRYAHSNVPGTADYDSSKETEYIMYLDANNLYGHAQSQMLPVSNFSFLTAKETVEFDCRDIDDNSPYGYILEVDLDYPAELHNDHNDYPLAPEHLAIRREMLSPCQLDMLKTLGIKPPTGSASCVKLIPNLYGKKNYVVHYRNLKFYLQQGLVLTKIHRVLRFVQSAWLTPYVEFNTKRRQEAKSPFERNFFKLLINSLFGKLMQNLRGQSNAKIVIDASQARRFIAKPTFKSYQIVSEDVVIVSMGKGDVLYNRPIYCGFAVLELSKLHMYEFHYNHMKKLYGPRAKLLFTDTDSLCYSVRTDDVYKNMLMYPQLYDTSDYPKDHPNFNACNAKKIGLFKDECASKRAKTFIGLRSKMYSILMDDGTEKQTAKGIGRAFAEKNVRHAQYEACLFGLSTTSAQYYSIRSVAQQLKTVAVNKRCLSPYDDKRYLMFGMTDTLAHGHFIATAGVDGDDNDDDDQC